MAKVTPKQRRLAIDESIAHWKRMIMYVKNDVAKDSPVHTRQLKERINETYGPNDCALCVLYDRRDDEGHYGPDCKRCPLGRKFGGCTADDKSKNAYRSIEYTDTWNKWLFNARRLLKQLESL